MGYLLCNFLKIKHARQNLNAFYRTHKYQAHFPIGPGPYCPIILDLPNSLGYGTNCLSRPKFIFRAFADVECMRLFDPQATILTVETHTNP